MGIIADAIAAEGRAKYNESSKHGDRDIYRGLTFWSPNVNIFCDPKWGRGHETYGEGNEIWGKDDYILYTETSQPDEWSMELTGIAPILYYNPHFLYNTLDKACCGGFADVYGCPEGGYSGP